jgi:hypothetical protein
VKRAAARMVATALLFAAFAGCDEDPAVVGPPPSQSVVSCVGVPAPKCDELVTRILDGLSISSFRSIRIACTKVPCTERAGEVTIDVVDSQGRRSSTGEGWATLGEVGVPAPEPSG